VSDTDFLAAASKAFIFDSSRRLKLDSNFLRKIAPVRTNKSSAPIARHCGDSGRNRMGTRMSELSGQELCGEPQDVASCFERGIACSSGREVEIDLVEAHKWFNIAAALGHAEGAQMRREIAELMSDSDIGRAQRAARDWLKANPLPAMPV
jgi:uncharacterized protein